MQETLSHFQVKQHIIKFGVQGDNHAICLVFVAKKKKKQDSHISATNSSQLMTPQLNHSTFCNSFNNFDCTNRKNSSIGKIFAEAVYITKFARLN